MSIELSSLLGCPRGLSRFYNHRWKRLEDIYLNEYVKPGRGRKVLDIGCGPADILNYMPDVQYTGFDISREYIAAAQKRFGNKGRFFCDDVGMINIEREWGASQSGDGVGVVHHLGRRAGGAIV